MAVSGAPDAVTDGPVESGGFGGKRAVLQLYGLTYFWITIEISCIYRQIIQ
jgi:hypothetical protein